MKDEFLATLSHELRTPLNAILGWAQLLRRSDGDAQEHRHGLDIIERNARAQTQLIEDLLDMSRIVAGQLRLDVQPVQLSDVIEAAIQTVAPAATARSIRIEKVLDPRAGPVRGDPARLQQVVWNLLANAIKFTPKGGKAQVTLERVNSHVELSVTDNGEGIAAEFLPHVFDRFRQGDGTTTRRHGGLGLGLSIAKCLIEMHGGSIRAKSPGVSLGATFTVILPLSAAHPYADDRGPRLHPRGYQAIGTEEAAPATTLDGLRVLIVDDEEDARFLIRRVLEGCGALVSDVASASEGLVAMGVFRPDVLVSDIGMPDVDGYEFIARVRALGETGGGKIPAVALTAFARSEDRTRALLAGYLVHVSKPVEPSELIATVASAAGRTGNGPRGNA
jgi:CheY-like chemotaxis protein/two-component sensor histidine kinase